MKKLILVGIMALSMASFAQNENNIFTYEDEIKSGTSINMITDINYMEDSFEVMMKDRQNGR